MSANRRVWIVTLIAASLWGCNGTFHISQQASFHQTADVQNASALVVETRNGGVDVRCDANAREASISGTKSASAATIEAARDMLDRINIRAQREAGRPDTLKVVAEFPPEPNFNAGVSFQIVVPPAMAMDIRTSNGPIGVSGAARNLMLRTSNGPIRAEKIGGQVTAETSNGAVSLKDVAGDVNASSSNGPIDVQRSGQNQIRAITSNGRIRAIDTRGAIHLETSNSSIELETRWLPPKPQVNVSSTNGGIKILLPCTVAAQLHLDTSNGRVVADFGKTQVSGLRITNTHAEAELNGGGGQIRVRTSNSSITFGLIPPVAESQP